MHDVDHKKGNHNHNNSKKKQREVVPKKPVKVTNKYSGERGNNATRAADGKPVHKQETRLRKWQQAQKEKYANDDFVPSYAQRKRKRTDEEAKKVDKKETYHRGNKSGSEAKLNQNRKERTPNQRQQDGALSGGLSASLTTEKTILRNKGAIITEGINKAKKIVFDDD